VDNGQTPLHIAAQHGREGTVRLLLDRGADVSAESRDGDTPLHDVARDSGHEGVARALIHKGADVEKGNTAGLTPLHKAAIFGNEVVAVLLLEHGADVSAKTG
ncbi:ankyrin repeat-containing domain protein, partial [Baffinella frigidus]